MAELNAKQQAYADFLATDGDEDDHGGQHEAVEQQSAVAAEPLPAAPIVSNTANNDELFAGFSALSPEIQDTIRAKLGESSAETKRVQQQYAAVTGRLAPTQRELEQARQKLQEIERRNQPDPRVGVDRLREIDPDTHQAVRGLNDYWQSRFSQLEQHVQQQNETVQQFQLREYQTAQWGELTKIHPDATEIARSDMFNQWCAALPPKAQERLLAATAEDTAMVFDEYKKDLALAEFYLEKEQQQAAPAAQRKRPAIDPSPASRSSASTVGPSGPRPRNEREARYAAFLATDTDDD